MKQSLILCCGNQTKSCEQQSKPASKELAISYEFAQTELGAIIVASTERGLCFVGFANDEQSGVTQLQQRFAGAKLTPETTSHIKLAVEYLKQPKKESKTLDKLTLDLCGTPFQLKVWSELLKIPYGTLTTYSQVAQNIGKPSAYRAVANAVGSNPISILIPCHRVVRTGGALGGYYWGLELKKRVLASEQA